MKKNGNSKLKKLVSKIHLYTFPKLIFFNTVNDAVNNCTFQISRIRKFLVSVYKNLTAYFTRIFQSFRYQHIQLAISISMSKTSILSVGYLIFMINKRL